MPAESCLYGKFTTESDVWSFGVVLWEIFSFGQQPYYGYSNTEVIEMVRARQLLPCPAGCPAHIFGLMRDCWSEVPTQRPNFYELHARLRSWQAVHARDGGGGGAGSVAQMTPGGGMGNYNGSMGSVGGVQRRNNVGNYNHSQSTAVAYQTTMLTDNSTTASPSLLLGGSQPPSMPLPPPPPTLPPPPPSGHHLHRGFENRFPYTAGAQSSSRPSTPSRAAAGKLASIMGH